MNESSKNIVLIGMAGVGKTTIGRVLSKKIHRKFLDIDQEFEEQTKIRITEFFAIYGENEFRNNRNSSSISFSSYVSSVINYRTFN